jgi:hypothetical protein
MTNSMTRDPLYIRSSSLRRRASRAFLSSLGLSYSRASKRQEILSFFQMLWPTKMENGLRRLGSDADGGYLLPRGIGSFDVIFSPGVADNWEFERNYLDEVPTANIFMADGSVDQRSLGELPLNVQFAQKFVGVQETLDCLNFTSRICERYDGKDGLLSMDIEGQEYEILGSAPDFVFQKFKCMVIEFHGLQLVGSREGLAFVDSIIRRLLVHFEIGHLHGNNYADPVTVCGLKIPSVIELTFVRKDLKLSSDTKVESLPHVLDVPNCSKPDFAYDKYFLREVVVGQKK